MRSNAREYAANIPALESMMGHVLRQGWVKTAVWNDAVVIDDTMDSTASDDDGHNDDKKTESQPTEIDTNLDTASGGSDTVDGTSDSDGEKENNVLNIINIDVY